MTEESLTDVRGTLLETLSTFDQEPSIKMMSWNGSLFDGREFQEKGETQKNRKLEFEFQGHTPRAFAACKTIVIIIISLR